MDITFSCSQCGQNIVIDEAGAGMELPCPGCQQTLVVPSPQPETLVILSQLCPKCERAWPEQERVCDHCGTSLKNGEQVPTLAPAATESVVAPRVKTPPPRIKAPSAPAATPPKLPTVEEEAIRRAEGRAASQRRNAEKESRGNDGWEADESGLNKMGTYLVFIPCMLCALLSWGMFGIQLPAMILCVVVGVCGIVGGILNILGRGPVAAGAVIGFLIGVGGYGTSYWWMHGRESVYVFEVTLACVVGALPGYGLQYALQVWLRKRAGSNK